MAEYIKREAALSAQNKSMNLAEMRKRLERIPAADVVERKTGSWRHYDGELTCSECSVTIYDDIMSLLGDDVPRFCPNCGAKMIGGDDDEKNKAIPNV